MILHAFYNKENIGDILLVRLNDDRTISYFEKNDDICALIKNEEIIGFNILNASKYFENLNIGKIKLNEKFVNQLNSLLVKYGYDEVTTDYNDHFVVGKITDISIHPDSDHMHVCKVDNGSEILQIVCGAPNVEEGQLVVIAEIGAVMPSGLIIKPSKLRGIDSNGMLCSPRELALPNAPLKKGILVLDPKNYNIGEKFFK